MSSVTRLAADATSCNNIDRMLLVYRAIVH